MGQNGPGNYRALRVAELNSTVRARSCFSLSNTVYRPRRRGIIIRLHIAVLQLTRARFHCEMPPIESSHAANRRNFTAFFRILVAEKRQWYQLNFNNRFNSLTEPISFPVVAKNRLSLIKCCSHTNVDGWESGSRSWVSRQKDCDWKVPFVSSS